jgi:hypothetical protein
MINLQPELGKSYRLPSAPCHSRVATAGGASPAEPAFDQSRCDIETRKEALPVDRCSKLDPNECLDFRSAIVIANDRLWIDVASS